MVLAPFAAAARIREVLMLLDADSPAPYEIRVLVRRLAAGTVFGAWFAEGQPSARELLVICGQLAAARPGAGLAEAFLNLSRDCQSEENTVCPMEVVSVYESLASAVPKFGPAPELRGHLLAPGLLFPGVQEVAALAAAAAGLLELDAWDVPDPDVL